jgi:hypothetical protein
MTDGAGIGSDLSRLKTFIQQGKQPKIERLLHEQPKRMRYFLDEQFDACAYATKFRQKILIQVLNKYGAYFYRF